MELFMKIFGSIIFILLGLLGICYSYIDKVSPKWVNIIFGYIDATTILILGPILCWMVW